MSPRTAPTLAAWLAAVFIAGLPCAAPAADYDVILRGGAMCQ